MFTFTVMGYCSSKYLIVYLFLISNCLIGQSETDRADSLKQVGNYAEALNIFKGMLDKDIKTGNLKEQGKDYNNMANVYCDMGQYNKSTDHYFKALKLLEQSGDVHAQVVIYYNIANNYNAVNSKSYTKEYLNKAIALAKDKKGEEVILGLCYQILGTSHIEKRNFDSALVYLKSAADVFEKTDNADFLANIYMSTAYLGLDKHDYMLAKEYALKGLSIYKRINDPVGVAASYINLNAAHYYTYNTKELTDKKAAYKAIEYLDSAFYAVKDLEGPETVLKIYKGKQEIYMGLKQFDSAFSYQTKYSILKDTIHSIEKNSQIEELKFKYDFEKQEQEKELLNAKSEKRTLLAIIAFASAGCLLLIFGVFVLRSRYKKKQKEIEFEKNLLEYEQQALRAQMNPHFIFNAINSIQKFILKKDKQEAYDYLAKFAKLIRIVLSNSLEKDLSLGQELEMIKLYVELEQLRFNNSFEFNLEVNKNVNEQTITVPAMLIQPYVENAIWHGIMNLDNKRGILNLIISVANGVLIIVIEDNGIGRERAKKFKEADTHKPVGMVLTEKRLEMINKLHEYKHAKVTVTDLYDENKKPNGTKVEITMPVNEKSTYRQIS